MGTTTGAVSLLRFGETCPGYAADAPSHVLQIDTGAVLRVAVTAPHDTTLVVETPSGAVLCNDDAQGVNPVISGEFEPGVYRVWVGSYVAGDARPYLLTVERPSSGGATATMDI